VPKQEVKTTKKKFVLASLLIAAVIFLPSVSLVVSSAKAEPIPFVPPTVGSIHPDAGNPNYYLDMIRYASAIGSFAYVRPTTVGFSGNSEYWSSVVAVNDGSDYYAEIAVDVTYNSGMGSTPYDTIVYCIYSNPSVWPGGTEFYADNLGYSAAPQQPEVAVYIASGTTTGTTWDWIVGTTTIATHNYGTAWTADYVGVSVESYQQPTAHTSGQTLVTDYELSYKNTGGVWTDSAGLTSYFSETSGYEVTPELNGDYYYMVSTAS
jgi:hypothetical protein